MSNSIDLSTLETPWDAYTYFKLCNLGSIIGWFKVTFSDVVLTADMGDIAGQVRIQCACGTTLDMSGFDWLCFLIKEYIKLRDSWICCHKCTNALDDLYEDGYAWENIVADVEQQRFAYKPRRVGLFTHYDFYSPSLNGICAYIRENAKPAYTPTNRLQGWPLKKGPCSE